MRTENSKKPNIHNKINNLEQKNTTLNENDEIKNNTLIKDKTLLRKNFRAIRNHIEQHDNINAAQKVANFLDSIPEYNKSKHFSLYYPFDGEISTVPLMNKLINDRKICYLPHITHDQKKKPFLQFSKFTQNTKLIKNKFGILEPENSKILKFIDLIDIDIIIVPCVAFDRKCHRLGLGGGYYDMLLKEIATLKAKKKILSIGIAFSLQETNKIPNLDHDMPLNIIITENELIYNNS